MLDLLPREAVSGSMYRPGHIETVEKEGFGAIALRLEEQGGGKSMAGGASRDYTKRMHKLSAITDGPLPALD